MLGLGDITDRVRCQGEVLGLGGLGFPILKYFKPILKPSRRLLNYHFSENFWKIYASSIE